MRIVARHRQHGAAHVFRTALHQGIAQRVHSELDAPRATVTDVERRQTRRNLFWAA
jgi:hypothetical protein